MHDILFLCPAFPENLNTCCSTRTLVEPRMRFEHSGQLVLTTRKSAEETDYEPKVTTFFRKGFPGSSQIALFCHAGRHADLSLHSSLRSSLHSVVSSWSHKLVGGGGTLSYLLWGQRLWLLPIVILCVRHWQNIFLLLFCLFSTLSASLSLQICTVHAYS